MPTVEIISPAVVIDRGLPIGILEDAIARADVLEIRTPQIVEYVEFDVTVKIERVKYPGFEGRDSVIFISRFAPLIVVVSDIIPDTEVVK